MRRPSLLSTFRSLSQVGRIWPPRILVGVSTGFVVPDECSVELPESWSRRRGGRQDSENRVSHLGRERSGRVMPNECARDLLCSRERRGAAGIGQAPDQRSGVGVCDVDAVDADAFHATEYPMRWAVTPAGFFPFLGSDQGSVALRAWAMAPGCR